MENTSKLLRIAFYTIVFFTGISFLSLMSREVFNIADQSADVIASDNILYEAPLQNQRYLIKKNEIIAQLMEDIQYDISIVDSTGTHLIYTESFNPEDITDLVLTSDQYEKSYTYNEEGDIEAILYRYVQ